MIAAAVSGAALSLGAMAGFLTVLGLAVRHGILLINRYRELRDTTGLGFGPELVQRGTRERATPILMTALVTAAAVLPFACSARGPATRSWARWRW